MVGNETHATFECTVPLGRSARPRARPHPDPESGRSRGRGSLPIALLSTTAQRFSPVRGKLKRHALPALHSHVRAVPAAVGSDGGALGAELSGRGLLGGPTVSNLRMQFDQGTACTQHDNTLLKSHVPIPTRRVMPTNLPAGDTCRYQHETAGSTSDGDERRFAFVRDQQGPGLITGGLGVFWELGESWSYYVQFPLGLAPPNALNPSHTSRRDETSTPADRGGPAREVVFLLFACRQATPSRKRC
jgi:hypothetical protein